MGRIFVTGIGLISAIGDTVAENRRSLVAGRSGIGNAAHLQSKYTGLLPFGEVKKDTAALRALPVSAYPEATRTDLIALHALKEAINDAQLSEQDLRKSSTALISASTVGGMCLTDQMYADANTATTSGSPYLASYSNSASTLFLQSFFSIGGIVNTFNTACSSSANAIMYGARLLQNGLAERAIVGGADSLAKFTINGFNALMILSDAPCRPFDVARKGLNLGEAGAFIVLEKEEKIASPRRIYAELKGYGNTNDAYHPSSTSENADGPFLCMQEALQTAGLRPQDIDFINAHGTATENNDETESVAMLRLFDRVPAFASTKSYTGHTLGAAGAVEAIYSILNLHHQEIYPSLNFETPIEKTGLIPVQAYEKQALRYVMSNSFGFGGNCSSLIFGQYP
ncbi:beta-ketoacyl-[acyl-carrier-protein] synthase family protein [Niabella drilacis]|uniref:3-oxoacyl-(Acyl-carrier-protein) synthase n=1 Tax=Niabella drilacis (strain DSM 25811 / CCM 8410 / CCUG 62505 / LMG 26954 / E90) TaxID=1285928 RepID=A0A1G6YSX2_NIADE|nr:beta-ketoacyl-[acyl-carrier-protein] synthase family protein [Niabella drilacis]SDD93440.1 3-oxoacyl-(acyl-carrier-protein) synthase [Niabella drilacis]